MLYDSQKHSHFNVYKCCSVKVLHGHYIPIFSSLVGMASNISKTRLHSWLCCYIYIYITPWLLAQFLSNHKSFYFDGYSMYRPIFKLFSYPVAITKRCFYSFQILHITLSFSLSNVYEAWTVNVLHYALTFKVYQLKHE